MLKKTKTFMPDKILSSFLDLPVELVYRILDHLNQLEILFSVRNVCIRLDAITDTYHRYKVNGTFFIQSDSYHR